MASYTTNLNLKKPAGSENVSIGDINSNMDAIDQAYGELNGMFGKTIGSSANPVTSLSDIPVNSTGWAIFDTTTHPAGVKARLNFFCFGTNAYRMLVVFSDSSGSLWTNACGSGTWRGWKSVTQTNV